MTADNHEARGSAAASGFFDHLEELARTRGVTVDQILDEERKSALGSPQPTDDCLVPDEVEELLTTRGVSLIDGSIAIADGASIPDHLQAAAQHAQGCTFCAPLLQLMQPRMQEKAVFMREVEEARGREAASHASSRSPSFVRALRPMALPGAIGCIAAATWTPSVAHPWSQSLSVSWPYVMVAGLAGAGLAIAASRAGMLPGRVRIAADRMHSSPAITAVATASAFLMLLIAGTGWLVTSQTVNHRQREMLSSALDGLAATAQSDSMSVDALLANFPAETLRALGSCSSRKNEQVIRCLASERIPVPGAVMTEIRQTGAEVYWQVNGKRLREVELLMARVRQDEDGSKRLALATGATTPINANAGKRYPPGSAVLALTRNDAGRLLDDVAFDRSAGEFPIIEPKNIHTAAVR